MSASDEQKLGKELKVDWTCAPGTTTSNTAPRFLELGEEVGRLIRNSAHSLMAGRSDDVGHLVMAQLAHKHGLAPTDIEVRELLDENSQMVGVFIWNGLPFRFTAEPIAVADAA